MGGGREEEREREKERETVRVRDAVSGPEVCEAGIGRLSAAMMRKYVYVCV